MCFSPPSPQLPPAPPAPPTPEDPAVKAKAEQSRLAAQNRRGLLSTIKTDQTTGSDLMDGPKLVRKTALGE